MAWMESQPTDLRLDAEGGRLVAGRRAARGASGDAAGLAPSVRPYRSSACPAGTPCILRNWSSTASSCDSTCAVLDMAKIQHRRSEALKTSWVS